MPPVMHNPFTATMIGLRHFSMAMTGFIRSHDFAPAFRCLGQIHASSEGPFARSGKNHGPHAVVCIDLQNLVMERSAHFGGQRIELFGPISA